MRNKLTDLKHRDIHTRKELKGIGVIKFGLKIFDLLRDIKSQNIITMCFFTHYYEPPDTPPHVKVGIRFKKKEDLIKVNKLIDELCYGNRDIVTDPGEFKSTRGYDPLLSEEIIIDYIICHSFDLLAKLKKEFGTSPPSFSIIGNYILKNRIEIEEKIMGKDIFRNKISKSLGLEINKRIWERFIHHLCNAYQISNDYQIKLFLRDNGIPILI